MASSTIKAGERPVGRKFIVACDGTWQNSDMGVDTSPFSPPSAQIPTNVTRIIRALNHRDSDGVTQVAFYQRGVGTDNLQDMVVGGLTGNDIGNHIREAYAFVANNFNPESQKELDDVTTPLDQIVLLGFSRGAYTARAIASLISDIGLLTKLGMESFWAIFGDWMKQDVEGQQSLWFVATYKDVAEKFQQEYGRKIAFTDKVYRDTLIEQGLTRWGMPIRAVGVWDTVGALGIPIPWDSDNVKPFSFVNTRVPRAVQHAFHALAIDERRNLFTPTMWEEPDQAGHLKTLKQCWFPGSHSNIGGSYPDAGISNITLAWMVSQLEEHDGGILSFNPDYLDFVQDLNNRFYASEPEPVRPWGFGKLYDSSLVMDPVTLANALLPGARTLGRYHRVDTANGKQTSVPLRGTGESIHRCVRVRIDGGGRGLEEVVGRSAVGKFLNVLKKAVGATEDNTAEGKLYRSPALGNYVLVQPAVDQDGADNSGPVSGVFWRGKDGKGDLPEDVMGRTEIRLLKRSLGVS
ncbi:uncharacterized protein L3040_002457 [Drepanopeziza brunnea f. sp. 'multigermtubi']|uniref:uncharacterized protein n=1 Tax=Drepanopeziza brunnea f. sp. 'multigermtubi' TaxID=698441 RepID=UPI0023A073EA|nr:hypothetical protein L3040_002457 [Drepanopeziza brunnea f. sp. 'multigermtubi']